MKLIDEMICHLPIPAYPSSDLAKSLARNGISIQPDTELKIIHVADSGDGGGIACVLDTINSKNLVISLTLLRIKPGHPLAEEISAYQRQRIRSLFRSRGLNPRASPRRR